MNKIHSKNYFFPVIFIILFSLVSGQFLDAKKKSDISTLTKKKEKNNKDKKTKEKAELYYKMTVTATGSKKDTFNIPKSVSVVNNKEIREKAPDNISDLFLELPGVDVNGVGSNQSRPVIRGMRGQRILLMEDGIRMNNSRRQQDFGEIPALVDISDVERVEVVRGPASVLYGSDAIGGVVNIITRVPQYDIKENGIHGDFGYRYSSADGQNKGVANINGNFGKLGFMLSGNYKKANNYTAPSGSFGEIELSDDTTVYDTGVKDGGVNLLLNYKMTGSIDLSFKYEYYHAVDAGFGFVDPDDYAPGSARIQIRYPDQKVEKYTFKYENNNMDFALADHIGFTAYYRGNERQLKNDIFVPFGIPGKPDAGISILTDNYTDINTTGLRLEFNKKKGNHLFTYGTDFFHDSTNNSDTNITQIIGFGPPRPSEDNTPSLPNASYSSMGFFFQDDISLFHRTSLIFGIRYQSVNADTKETLGLENEPLANSNDNTFVGSVNFSYGITDDLKFVVSVGRGFRSPNLIERFFNGATPEGSAYQSRNTELNAETSLNFDLGFKLRLNNFFLESSYFNNTIYDGIRISPTGETIYGLPEYKNVNIDKLRTEGYEISGGVYFKFGLQLTSNYTKMDSSDIGNPDTPYVDTFSSKFNLNVKYEHPKKLFRIGYNIRINGEQKEVQLGDNPIGATIPGFTVHSLSAGVTLFKKSRSPQRIGIIVGNLTNTLYTEFSNASFFRPAPGRHIVFTWSTVF
ncbi:MAG: TonB-dependent receptor [Acidobacteriota bacterium]